MKRVVRLSIICLILLSFTSQTPQEIEQFRTDISENKSKAKKSLDGYRYDGSKVTYFNYKEVSQKKELEVFLFNKTEYKLVFNAELVPSGINVNVYDADKNDPNRTLLSENPGVEASSFYLLSSNLNDMYASKYKDAARLKRVFVEYEIIGNETYVKANKGEISNRGAVVLAMGYEM
jgi:hypothetical protein